LSEGLCGDPFVVAKPFFLEAIGLIKFEERTFELVEGMPELAEIVASLLEARWKLLKPGEPLHDILALLWQIFRDRRVFWIPKGGFA
jgi:hypothetical protein